MAFSSPTNVSAGIFSEMEEAERRTFVGVVFGTNADQSYGQLGLEEKEEWIKPLLVLERGVLENMPPSREAETFQSLRS